MEGEIGAERQQPRGRGIEPRVEVLVLDEGVLDPGDSVGSEHAGDLGEGRHLGIAPMVGKQGQDRVDGAPLAQCAQGRPILAPHDLAADRLRRGGVDAGATQALTVDPQRVVVHRQQRDGAVGDDGVEPPRVEPAIGRQARVEPLADDPVRVGVRRGPAGDRLENLLHAAGVAHRSPAQAPTSQEWVGVTIAERGQQRATGKVDDLRTGSAAPNGVVAQGYDPLTRNGERVAHRLGRHTGSHRPANKEQIRPHQAPPRQLMIERQDAAGRSFLGSLLTMAS